MAGYSRTWWGERFLTELEQITDAGRLARGRSYARGGRVVSYKLQGNKVTARVRGSINPYFGVYKEPLYTTTISMTPIEQRDWKVIIEHLASNARLVVTLLMNEMPDTIDEALADLGVHLLPHDRSDFVTQCSCPDWGNPCKHIAGLFYLLAADLDSDPFLLFELRGLSREFLRKQLASSKLGQILAAELTPREAAIQPDTSYYTRPERRTPLVMGYREFWLGTKRLPELGQAPPPAMPALLIRKQGDYPAFWRKNTSFIETMEEVYARVRSKSLELK